MQTAPSVISYHQRTELSDEALRAAAPSIFAASASPEVSKRYAFAPTALVIDRLRNAGWSPVSAQQHRVKANGKAGFQKHLVRFQLRGITPIKGEYTPELILTNAHDRSSVYCLEAGIWRFTCSNGMFVSDSMLEKVTMRHAGFEPQQIVDASLRICDRIPSIVSRVEQFRSRELNATELTDFATAALALRYDDITKAPVGADGLLSVRRDDDVGVNLWNTFNRVQENLIRGGVADETRVRANGHKIGKMRGITGLDRNIELNRKLWALAEMLADAKN